ncbi:MAG: hypothetical protein R3243_03395 [Arenibacter latericius]|nr:hypothetical protein [Arenibacter latericius]
MVRKYATSFVFSLFYVFTILLPMSVLGQELKVFRVQDFNLNGAVKSCMVITNYGKEEYQFNREGILTKAITRYNDEDYDITLYKIKDTLLLEKRLENYRDGKFVRNTSIANLYEVDTTQGKIVTEKIISYNKEFLDQYEYEYDVEGKLVSIKRINDKGIDETAIIYEKNNGEFTETHYLDDVILKSIRTSVMEGENKKNVLIKDYLEGMPYKAYEQIFTDTGKVLSEVQFTFNKSKNTFEPIESKNYEYNLEGDLIAEKIKKGKSVTEKNYHYQYDGSEIKNWIRQIVTPDNTYTSRRIQYYPKEEPQESKM